MARRFGSNDERSHKKHKKQKKGREGRERNTTVKKEWEAIYGNEYGKFARPAWKH